MSDNYDANLIVNCTTQIVAAYVKNSSVCASEVPEIIGMVEVSLRRAVDGTLARTGPVPAVSVSHSINDDHLICLVCGQKMSMLKRHLNSTHDLSPASYRRLFNLSVDYPLTAPSYAETRSRLAKKFGLGLNRMQI